MKHGLTKIQDILGDFHVIQKPDLRGEPKTPAPIKTKVASSFPRIPINKQAAMIIARAPYWAKLDPGLYPASVQLPKPEDVEAKHLYTISILRSQVTNLNQTINKMKSANDSLIKDSRAKDALVSGLQSELDECKRKIEIARKTLPFL